MILRPHNNKHTHLYITYCMPGHINYILSTLIILTHTFLKAAICGGYSYYPCFTDERTEAQGGKLSFQRTLRTHRVVIFFQQPPSKAVLSTGTVYNGGCVLNLHFQSTSHSPHVAAEHLKMWLVWPRSRILHLVSHWLLYLNWNRRTWLVTTVLDKAACQSD